MKRHEELSTLKGHPYCDVQVHLTQPKTWAEIVAISEKGGLSIPGLIQRWASFWEGKTELGPPVKGLKSDSHRVDIASLSSVPLNLLSPRSECLVAPLSRCRCKGCSSTSFV